MWLGSSSAILRRFFVLESHLQDFCRLRLCRNVHGVIESSPGDPEYPRIEDISYKAVKEREVLKWHSQIKNLPTVEEKLLELNMPKYHGHWTCHLTSLDVRYNHQDFIEFATRSTSLAGWPELYSKLDAEVDKYLPFVKKKVEEILLLELVYRSRVERTQRQREKEISEAVIGAINRVIISLLSDTQDHIADCQVDVSPRLEAFWFLGGVPPTSHQLSRRKLITHLTEEDWHAPATRAMQYLGSPALQVRARLPLPALATSDHPAGRQAAPRMPLEAREPRIRGLTHRLRHGTNVPGVWPDASHTFSVLTYLTREDMIRHGREFDRHAEADRQDALNAKGCLASFASALAQACYQGFSPLTELTYPLTTQTVVTDGQHWSFFSYQLNTTGQLSCAPEQGAASNICWAPPELKLYESVTEGKVEGLNEEVLRRLLQMYILKPTDRDGIELRPYLDPQQSLDLVEDDWLRQRYRQSFFTIMSNRPRARPKDEIYLWEKIYKLYFQTRPQEARKRFFELWQGGFPKPKRLDEFTPKYVPRALRQGFVPARERKALKREKNEYHELAKLRGYWNEDPKFMQELEELESWRNKKD